MILLGVLFFTGILAGTVDAIAGGGGLITLPILLSAGIPPHLAFGTNKLQSTIGTFIATRQYHQHGLIKLNTIYQGLLSGLVGSILGSIIAQLLSSEVLRILIPFLLMSILLYTLCTPKLGHEDVKPRMREPLFFMMFGFALGFYDGFFGPGAGSLWMFCLAFFLGYNLMKATAMTKIFNLNSNFIAMLCFALGGNIDYRLGLVMAAGQIIGSKIGAHLAIKNGVRVIRPVFLLVVSSTILTQAYHLISPVWILVGVLLLVATIIYRKRTKPQVVIDAS